MTHQAVMAPPRVRVATNVSVAPLNYENPFYEVRPRFVPKEYWTPLPRGVPSVEEKEINEQIQGLFRNTVLPTTDELKRRAEALEIEKRMNRIKQLKKLVQDQSLENELAGNPEGLILAGKRRALFQQQLTAAQKDLLQYLKKLYGGVNEQPYTAPTPRAKSTVHEVDVEKDSVAQQRKKDSGIILPGDSNQLSSAPTAPDTKTEEEEETPKKTGHIPYWLITAMRQNVSDSKNGYVVKDKAPGGVSWSEWWDAKIGTNDKLQSHLLFEINNNPKEITLKKLRAVYNQKIRETPLTPPATEESETTGHGELKTKRVFQMLKPYSYPVKRPLPEEEIQEEQKEADERQEQFRLHHKLLHGVNPTNEEVREAYPPMATPLDNWAGYFPPNL